MVWSVYRPIAECAENGYRAFTLIGSYGTGKSSFLVALQKHLSGTKKYFTKKFTAKKNYYEFINIVCNYDSVLNNLNSKLAAKHKNIEIAISRLGETYSKKKKFIIVIFDEFGKVLEYARNNNPEAELYDIQKLAENIAQKNVIVLLIIF